MDFRRVVGVVLAGALLVGCQGKPTQGGVSTAPGASAVSPGGSSVAPGTNGHAGDGSTAVGQSGGSDGSSTGDFPVKPAPDVLERRTYATTQDIPGPGLYFVDVASGKVEGWRTKAAPEPRYGQFGRSEDSQWVTADDAGKVVWVKRSTGASYGWDRRQLGLLASQHGLFLFQRRRNDQGTNTFIVANADFQVVQSFPLNPVPDGGVEAHFAPDGKMLAINAEHHMGGKFDGQVYLVDVATGTSKPLGDLPEVKTGQVASARLIQPGNGQELLVGYDRQVIEHGLTRVQTLVRRYTWQGKLLGEFTLIGQAGHLSPDGRLLSSIQNLDQFANAVVVTDVTTGQPLFRVAGASGGWWWVADSSRLLLETRDGNLLVSQRGDLLKAPPLPKTETQSIMPGLAPAPDAPNLWAAGMAVIDGEGHRALEVKLPKHPDWLIWSLGWGTSSKEVVFSITPPVGKDFGDSQNWLTVSLQKPPFPEKFLLQVADPKGDCLNLRDSYSANSRVIRCLPTGTQLAAADLFQAPIKLNTPLYDNENKRWMWVQTEKGEQGWVAVSTGSVTWAN